MTISSELAQAINNISPGMNQFQVGSLLKDASGVSVGKVIYLNPTNGDDGNDGLSQDRAVRSLSVGYGKLDDGKNDVLLYVAGAKSISLSAGFVWAKSYTHFIGACSPTMVGQRSRIFQTAAATGVSPLFKVTGSGCIFKNLYVFHGVADATSMVCFEVTGERNVFESVHFAGIGNATMDVVGAASLKITGGSENVFRKCTIGLDTIARGENSVELLFASDASRNYFEDCLISAYVSNAGHALAEISGVDGIDRWNIFKGCIFVADSEDRGVGLTEVFKTPTGIVQGKIILNSCQAVNDGTATVWNASGDGTIWNNAVAAAATAGGGISTKL